MQGPVCALMLADSTKLAAAGTAPQLGLSLQTASHRLGSLVVEAHENVGLVVDWKLRSYEQVQQRSIAVSHPVHRQLLLDEEALPALAQLLHALLKCLQGKGRVLQLAQLQGQIAEVSLDDIQNRSAGWAETTSWLAVPCSRAGSAHTNTKRQGCCL